MPNRTLVATMGFDERHVLPALRLMPYDRLAVVGGSETFGSPGFHRLRALEPLTRAVVVPSFNLNASIAAIRRVIRLSRQDGLVRISVSGGTKIVASAAILAAFQEGVEAWYCDPDPVRLPVLHGLRIVDAFSPPERALALSVRAPVALERLVTRMALEGLPRRSVIAAIRSLAAKGLVILEARDGRSVVRPSERLPLFAAHLREPSGKA